MSSPPPTQEEEQQGGGAPMWMVTYGDSVTLLLTFFVLLLTFSTPNEDQYLQFARGLLASSRTLGLGPGDPSMNSMIRQQQRLAAARLASEGAETPPENSEEPLDDLRQYHESVDVSELRELVSAYVVRVPLVELFGVEEELQPQGRQILDHFVKMTRGGTYSVVVRASAITGATASEREARSIDRALKVVRYLRQRAPSGAQDLGVSNDECELSSPPLKRGECEIIMLEV
jgi:chemotaxis protein MotB